MATPFYLLQARRLSGVAEAEVGSFVAAQMLGALACNPLWGWWGDRRGKLGLAELGLGPRACGRGRSGALPLARVVLARRADAPRGRHPPREREDVAASLFLFFGDPGLGLLDWTPVPTLRYAWAAERVPIETVVDSPYLPGTVRTLVVESGEARLGRWLTARRNVAADFEKAFGHAPRDIIQAIALFTDNDQTREPAEAAYGAARALCAPG